MKNGNFPTSFKTDASGNEKLWVDFACPSEQCMHMQQIDFISGMTDARTIQNLLSMALDMHVNLMTPDLADLYFYYYSGPVIHLYSLTTTSTWSDHHEG